MTTYDEARTKLHEATVKYNEALAAYNDERDRIAHELRGTKQALSEADKRTVYMRMRADYVELCGELFDAERTKAECQLAYDIADNAAKNARREMDAATADKWMTISERLLEAARLNAEKEPAL